MFKNLGGTAREAAENWKYDKLEEKYGKEGAEAIIKPQLEERGVNLEDFRTYRKVRHVIHNHGLDVTKARKEAEVEAREAISEMFTLPA